MKFWLFIVPFPLLWADFGIQNQLELYLKYQNLKFELKDVIIYARLENANRLPRDWQLYFRLDIPYMWLWGKQKEIISIGEDGIIDSPDQQKTIVKKTPFKEQGLADLVTRAFFVTPFLDEMKTITAGFGSEFTFPTAKEPDLGTGKYSARPLMGVKKDFLHLGNGSSLAFLFKYQFSFAGNKHRPSFQIFYFQTVFVYTFGNNWALILYPECQYSIKQEKWFVPIAVKLTKGLTKHFFCSIAYQKGIVTSFPAFKDEVEFNLRYVF